MATKDLEQFAANKIVQMIVTIDEEILGLRVTKDRLMTALEEAKSNVREERHPARKEQGG